MRIDMDYEGLCKDLTDQSKVIGSSGKGWGKFAGTNRKAATAITDLLVENQSLRNAANGFKARAVSAEARAEKAERERDEAREVICERCRVLPCRGNECYWYRGQKEE